MDWSLWLALTIAATVVVSNGIDKADCGRRNGLCKAAVQFLDFSTLEQLSEQLLITLQWKVRNQGFRGRSV